MDIGGYIEKAQGKRWLTEAEEISRMLHGLMQALKHRT